jgi:cell division protein ZapA (FtsZ GTPase activity inhibitor)
MTAVVRKITVTVLGENYHLVSDEDEDMVRSAARVVELAMRDLRERTKDACVEDTKLAVLVALRMALMGCAQEQDIIKRTRYMLSLLDTTSPAV